MHAPPRSTTLSVYEAGTGLGYVGFPLAIAFGPTYPSESASEKPGSP